MNTIEIPIKEYRELTEVYTKFKTLVTFIKENDYTSSKDLVKLFGLDRSEN